jgi:predicted PurR-regulated permease PerM
MAYLLNPVVSKIVSWGTSRQRAVLFVFAAVSILFAGVLLWVIPAISAQSVNLARRVPGYTMRAKEIGIKFAEEVQAKYGVKIPAPLRTSEDALSPGAPPADLTVPLDPPRVPLANPSSPAISLGPPVPPVDTATSTAAAGATEADATYDLQHLLSGDWVRTTFPTVLRNTWNLIRSSVGGFLGVFGFLLSMIIVPIYLYYFLIESRNISQSWGDYIPLRASAFKDEVVSALAEINGYLIAFFRGQLLVSLINGTATGLGLVIVGLDFGLLIGLMLCVLGLIPYLGIVLCWIPAVIIAAVQGGAGTWIPNEPWWLFPLVVTGIFAVVQQIDGLFITPRIVGESVGLHPMTVIVSVFVWSLLMGGLLGAILAVPMTATVKVLLKRYVWQRRFMAEPRIVPTAPIPGARQLRPGLSLNSSATNEFCESSHLHLQHDKTRRDHRHALRAAHPRLHHLRHHESRLGRAWESALRDD